MKTIHDTRDAASDARHEVSRLLDADPVVAEQVRMRGMNYPPTIGDLVSLPTIVQVQTADLVLDGPMVRVWVERTGAEDGEPRDSMVEVERRRSDGHWSTFARYCGAYVNGEDWTQYVELY
jgi:hypothetical protein